MNFRIGKAADVLMMALVRGLGHQHNNGQRGRTHSRLMVVPPLAARRGIRECVSASEMVSPDGAEFEPQRMYSRLSRLNKNKMIIAGRRVVKSYHRS